MSQACYLRRVHGHALSACGGTFDICRQERMCSCLHDDSDTPEILSKRSQDKVAINKFFDATGPSSLVYVRQVGPIRKRDHLSASSFLHAETRTQLALVDSESSTETCHEIVHSQGKQGIWRKKLTRGCSAISCMLSIKQGVGCTVSMYADHQRRD